jgi:hypothetical protein
MVFQDRDARGTERRRGVRVGKYRTGRLLVDVSVDEFGGARSVEEGQLLPRTSKGVLGNHPASMNTICLDIVARARRDRWAQGTLDQQLGAKGGGQVGVRAGHSIMSRGDSEPGWIPWGK